MESQSKEHAIVLESQAHVWNHMLSFINSMSLKCAIDLGIPDIIHKHGKPMSLPQLISSLQIHPSKAPNIHRLMRLLTHSGFFTLHSDGYVLTHPCTLLLKDNPLSAVPFFLSMLDPMLTKPWYELGKWFQQGNDGDKTTPFEAAHGRAFWEYAWHVPRLYKLFDETLVNDSRMVGGVVVEKCKGVFEGLESLVDVGGGSGTMAKAIAQEFPKMECIVFDSPYVVGELKGSGNLKFVQGDMFQAIPPSDGLMLKWSLHDWNDEECLKILKKCKEAIVSKGKGGKLIIIDMVVDDEKGDYESIQTQLLFDLLTMVVLCGKERTEKEWANLFSSAGFSSYKITPVLGVRSLIEVYP
ncbi:putative O-methyltransferase 3 [Senna tora]|uniref:isoflavone 7-O-methyltransferase n=1 Tax=Senna tora TaxID=362788 RepID=A0A834WWA4_9FABA|nr:putative O-methyltransferase 3 [Senna tora]